MKVRVVSGVTDDPAWQAIARYTRGMNAEWGKGQARFGVEVDVLPPAAIGRGTSGRPPSWAKLWIVAEQIAAYAGRVDYVVWCDADCVLNMECSLRMQPSRRDCFRCVEDVNGINCGVMCFPCTEKMHELLKEWYESALGSEINHPWWEQKTLHRLVAEGGWRDYVDATPIDCKDVIHAAGVHGDKLKWLRERCEKDSSRKADAAKEQGVPMTTLTQAQFFSTFGPPRVWPAAGVYLQAVERAVLVTLCGRARAQRVLEFGCQDGGTADAILSALPGIVRYDGVDLPQGMVPVLDGQRTEKPVEAGAKAKHHAGFFVKLIDSRNLTRAELRVGYDFVFIDGGHDYETVKHDSELALQLVSRGGVIAWHDYNDIPANGVKTVVDKINAEVGGRIIAVEGTWLCFLWV
jgi:predicted O-methyltransferase YrrM